LRRLASLLLFGAAFVAGAEARPRLVMVKADGLPADVVDRWVHTFDPKTGRSELPWIEYVFLERGAWVRNFYTRGISLSAPSWSMLDTGEHLLIRGNAEYDRFTLRTYDYLNFFPFYVNYARSRRVDMPGVEVLDEAGVPLLIDRFDPSRRYQSMQLFQRGVRWKTLEQTLRNRFASRSLRQLFDEWQTGFEFSEGLSEQMEREIRSRIADGSADYLDFFFGDYDHNAHLASDESITRDVLKELDALVGRLWTSIQNSPRAAETIFVLVSDHGMNSTPGVYSQGYNLIRLFGSAEGGGHHVITNRYPMTEYKLKGLDPFVSQVTTPSPEPLYLRGQAAQYPTALLDLDGNERASVHLRNSTLNRIHILLQRLTAAATDARAREQVRSEVMSIVDGRRPSWKRTVNELEEELAALSRAIERQRSRVSALPKKENTPDARRERAALDSWEQDLRGYRAYLDRFRKLAALHWEDLRPGAFRIEDLIPPRALGDPNALYDLQNYVAGPDTRIDYFKLLSGLRVRINVQTGVGAKPVDLIAARLSPELAGLDAASAVFVYGDEDHQAVVLSRNQGGGVAIRYIPAAHLRADENGAVTFEQRPWAEGFPLKMFEDPNLAVEGDRAAWLSEWHSDREWLAATHRTLYSNGVVGLTEQFGPVQLGRSSRLWRDAGSDTEILRRFEQRKRRLVEADLLILASNHWNFNVRGFNPGGNHGSFFRVSTNSTLMLAGAGIPKGRLIEQPYDSLSFVPTILKLTGSVSGGWAGPVIEELTAKE
jgi:hypothetical protein